VRAAVAGLLVAVTAFAVPAAAHPGAWELGLGVSAYYNASAPGDGAATNGAGATLRVGRRPSPSYAYGLLFEALHLDPEDDADETEASQQDLVFFVRGYLSRHVAIEGALGLSRYAAKGTSQGCGDFIRPGCLPMGPFDEAAVKATIQGALVFAVPIEDTVHAELGIRFVLTPGGDSDFSDIDPVSAATNSLRADAALVARF
jgi:hypothetical protein